MKHIKYYILILLCCITSCVGKTTTSPEETTTTLVAPQEEVVFDITTKMENKKQELLSVADSLINSYSYFDDSELRSSNPDLYQLIDRIFIMYDEANTAEDRWAWMLAVNESVDEYNLRLERQDITYDSVVQEIIYFMGGYFCGTQGEMNMASYVVMLLDMYRAILKYNFLIESLTSKEASLAELYFEEYRRWFDITTSLWYIKSSYTHAFDTYTSLALEINMEVSSWLTKRCEELDVENAYIKGMLKKATSKESKSVSEAKFDTLIAFFKSRTEQNVIADYAVREELSIEEVKERIGDMYLEEEVLEKVSLFESALKNWLIVRENIAKKLDSKAGKLYRNMTNQIYTNLYNDLLKLRID